MRKIMLDNDATLILGKRREGKTTLLIDRAIKTNSIIAVPTMAAAEYVNRILKMFGAEHIKIMNYDQLIDFPKGRPNTIGPDGLMRMPTIAIDDAESFISRILNHQYAIDAMTMSLPKNSTFPTEDNNHTDEEEFIL